MGHGEVLDPVVVVGYHAGQTTTTTPAHPDGLVDRVDDQPARHRGRHRPAQDPSGVVVDDERYVAPAETRLRRG